MVSEEEKNRGLKSLQIPQKNTSFRQQAHKNTVQNNLDAHFLLSRYPLARTFCFHKVKNLIVFEKETESIIISKIESNLIISKTESNLSNQNNFQNDFTVEYWCWFWFHIDKVNDLVLISFTHANHWFYHTLCTWMGMR